MRVVDGDTYELALDLGFGVVVGETDKWSFRLKDVDTPEVYGRYASEEGRIASEFVKGLLGHQPEWFKVRTFKNKNDNYIKTFGRYLADLEITHDETGQLLEEPVWLSDFLKEKGFDESDG